MSRRGMEHLLRSQFSLGADAAVAAGPVGRTAVAATDVTMHAEIPSYSRVRALYGREVDARRLLLEDAYPPPDAARGLVEVLDQSSPRRRRDAQPYPFPSRR